MIIGYLLTPKLTRTDVSRKCQHPLGIYRKQDSSSYVKTVGHRAWLPSKITLANGSLRLKFTASETKWVPSNRR